MVDLVWKKVDLTAICSTPDDNRDLELLWVAVTMKKGAALIGVMYHPPKPCYVTKDLMEHIDRSLDGLLEAEKHTAVILGGAFNGLNVEEVSIRTGIVPLIKAHIKKKKFLKMKMKSIPDQYNTKT